MPESAAGHSPARTPETTRDTPDSPVDLGHGGWLAAGRRTAREFKQDNLQDRAAALTYFSIQSIFPGLLVLVTLLGLLGTSVTQNLIDQLTKTVPGSRATPSSAMR